MPGQRNGVQSMADSSDGALLLPTAQGLLRLANGKAQLAYQFPGSIRDLNVLHILRSGIAMAACGSARPAVALCTCITDGPTCLRERTALRLKKIFKHFSCFLFLDMCHF